MTLRTVVADDQPLARERMARLLQEAGCEVLGILEDGDQVMAFMEARSQEVDALFLDVRMPGPDGVELLAEWGARVPTVLVTAFSDHAVTAFHHRAVDYLLKPISADRLSITLARLQEGQPAPLPTPGTQAARPTRIPVRTGRGVVFLEVRRISHFELEGDTVWVWVGGERFRTHWLSLGEVQSGIPGVDLVRIHRNLLIRAEAVVGVKSLLGGRARVRMPEGVDLVASRRGAQELRATLGLRKFES